MKKHFAQTHGIAMGTKMAVAFSVIFMADLEKRLLAASLLKSFVWKRFIDDIFSSWNIPMEEISIFVDFANSVHPTIKFTWKMSPNMLFFSTQRYSKDLVFQLLKFSFHKPTWSPLKLFSIHNSHRATLSIRKKGFIKGEALRLLRTNSVKENFDKHKQDLQQWLCNIGYPTTLVHKILTEFSSPTEQVTICNKTEKAKKICRLIPLITRPQRILKRFSWNTGTSFNRSLELHISLTRHRLYLTGKNNHLRTF